MAVNSRNYLMFALKILLGPAMFFIVSIISHEGLQYEAQMSAAVFIWVIVWWCFQPLPFGITALLPLLMLPLMNIMSFKETASIYGQQVLFFMLGVLLIGQAFKKHGLGDRVALSILSTKWVKGSVTRFVFVYMIVALLMTSLISLASLGIILPLGIATGNYISKEYQKRGIEINTRKLNSLIALAALYGIESGFMATVIASPTNIVALSLMEELLGISITFFQWLRVGYINGFVVLIFTFPVLLYFFKPEVDTIPGGLDYFKQQKELLGNMGSAEKKVMIVFLIIMTLWISSSFVSIQWLDFYWVTIWGVLALYLTPADIEKREGLLTSQDLLYSVNWNVLLLSTTGIGMAEVLQKSGFIEFVATQAYNMSDLSIIFVSSVGTVVLTNFVSGLASVTTMCMILFPNLGSSSIHPAVIARIISGLGVGMIFPWAGGTAAMVFAMGQLDLKDMIKSGISVTFIYLLLVVSLNMILVPLFRAYTIL